MPLILAARGTSSALSLLVMLVLVGAFIKVVQDRATDVRDGQQGQEEVELGADGYPLEEGSCADPALGCAPGEAGAGEIYLDAAETCVDVGYLCADVERDGQLRVMRWPEGSGPLRVRVPRPSNEDPARARALQRAAIDGIMAWHGQPFQFIIDDRATSRESADIAIQWASQLSGSQLGVTRVDWRRRGDDVRFRVLGLTLATRSPFNPQAHMEPRQVTLTAAHEMGHALGLPHSDNPGDVMYPQNTSRSLTSRDYRTMQGLYGLENGAIIRR